MSMDDVKDLKKQMLGTPIRPAKKKPAAQAARGGDADVHEIKAEPVRPRKAVTRPAFKRPCEGEDLLARAVVKDLAGCFAMFKLFVPRFQCFKSLCLVPE